MYLAALLRSEAALGGNGAVVRVAVQQAAHGEPMDDLIVDTCHDGEPARLSLQVKSSLSIGEGDSDFRAIIAEAVATPAKPDFRVGRDLYGFVAADVGAARLASLRRIIARAEDNINGTEFAARFAPKAEASKSYIALRDAIRRLVSPADDDTERDFYRHFRAWRLDGLEPGGDRYVELGNRLSTAANRGGPELFELLCRQVRLGEGTAKVWDRAALLSNLRTTGIRLSTSPRFASDIEQVTTLANNALADIRNDIAGNRLERATLVEQAEAAAGAHVLSTISGLPGCGKSAILKRCVEKALARGPILFLKSDRLEGRTGRALRGPSASSARI